MSEISQLFAGIGLSASAGVRAYLPLLIIALVSKYTGLIKLSERQTILTKDWVILVLVALAILEILADKVPGLDHISDFVHIPIRVGAGSLASYSVTGSLNPVLVIILGALVSGSFAAAKAKTRAIISAATVGHGNPFVSLGGDVFATIQSVISIIAPFLAILVVIIFAYVIYRFHRRRRRKKLKALEVSPPQDYF